ncbi:hypothetical protein JL720_15527 [Aureococcus anophagefferens]|nr:hypothetical protein JL720_15527 [Aureococcus anophagefferens]
MFTRVSAAHDCLADAKLRKAYDRGDDLERASARQQAGAAFSEVTRDDFREAAIDQRGCQDDEHVGNNQGTLICERKPDEPPQPPPATDPPPPPRSPPPPRKDDGRPRTRREIREERAASRPRARAARAAERAARRAAASAGDDDEGDVGDVDSEPPESRPGKFRFEATPPGGEL